MKQILPFVALLVLAVSCGKLSQSDILGEWTVEAIQVQEVTSNTDTGWKEQPGAGIVFVKGEKLSFEKKHIIPCPSVDASLRKYDNYPGYIPYNISGTSLVIPSVEFAYNRQEGDYMEAGQIALHGITFDVEIDDGRMFLSGTMESTDNLGNVKKRINQKIELHR